MVVKASIYRLAGGEARPMPGFVTCCSQYSWHGSCLVTHAVVNFVGPTESSKCFLFVLYNRGTGRAFRARGLPCFLCLIFVQWVLEVSEGVGI
ncbi:hypothetical protein HanRHA438_Chr05g0241721 [Helianthus annuus]|nr:hypothetical protein HanRHA438_Chr05g0241721 [Helianthus annuus]